MAIPYSAEKDDLYYPAKHAVFFPNGRPQSDAALCVELARLAYCRQDIGFGFDQERIRKILGRIQFTDCKFFETATLPNGGGSHALLALDGENKLAVLSFRGTDKDDPSDLSDDFNVLPQPWPAGGNDAFGFCQGPSGCLARGGCRTSINRRLRTPVHRPQSRRVHGHAGGKSAKTEIAVYVRLSAGGKPRLCRSAQESGQSSLCRLLRSRSSIAPGSAGLRTYSGESLLH